MIEKLVKYKHIFISLFIFIILIMILFISLFPKNTKNEFVYAEEIETKETDQNVTIKVDIKGSVKNPGVYQMKENDRVIDVINIAGGLLKEADTSLINLSKIVKDEMVIKIYNKNEIKKLDNKETIIKYIETEYGTDTVVFVKSDSRPDNAIDIDTPVEGVPEKGYWPVPVVIGISDTYNVEIVEGVNEGDEVFTQVYKEEAWY